MCGALKRLYGFQWRLATNFDTALLALLISAQRAESPAFLRRYCPFGHALGYGVVADDQVAVTIAAALTAVMMGLKIADARRDGTFGAHLAQKLTRGAVTKAEQTLGFYDPFLVGKLRDLDDQLVGYEVDEVSYDRLLLPTAQGLGHVLEFTAEFADPQEVAKDNRAQLQRLGQATGRLIYTLDCFEDLAGDVKKGQFNGLLASGLVTNRGKFANSDAREGLGYLVKRCKGEIELAMGQLKLFRYGAIISNILFLGLIPKAEQALRAAELEESL
jgi:hypothetical protein